MKTITSILILLVSKISFAQTPTEYFNKSADADQSGNFKLSLKYIDKALELDPLNIEYLNAKGYAQYELRMILESYKTLTKTIEAEPNYTAYQCRAIALETMAQFSLAIQDYTDAIDLAPNDMLKYVTYSNRGGCKS